MGTFFFSSPLSAEQAKDTLIYPACQYCGMDRHKFAHSRMLIEYDDGSTVPTCSIHCTAIDLAQKINATPAAIKVGDYDTKELIAAEGAIWILGGDRKGVMSSRPKWAFSSDAAAAAFVATHGGNIVTFDEAMKASYADMDSDSKSIRRKRQNKKMETMEHSNMTPTHDH
ncbi:MAG: nitrous oxide reductase accessory protein NosL [Proteobacteria bacterium]|nr:nitrous oxide reductase accessory protein NosL [Pseudomonadota bacterium]MBU1057481.1 nitrous oxide reductase accessory protein NosL [Pseudomonadota bacterium]